MKCQRQCTVFLQKTDVGLLPTQSSFVWKRDVDMPAGMCGARGLLLEDKLYIGGGDSKDISCDCVVHEYDINGLVRKWTSLPPSPVAYFAMAEVNKSLTLVGRYIVSATFLSMFPTCS